MDPACPVCAEPIREDDLVVYEHGELIHARCYNATVNGWATQEFADYRAGRTL